MIELHDLVKVKSNHRIIDNITLDVEGGITALLGPNGAGKTTLMRLIAGLDRPTHGTALVDGQPITSWNTACAHLGCLIDSPAIHPRWSAGQHLTFLGISQGLQRSQIRQVAEQCGVDAFHTVRGKALSLGMRQRVGIAMALLGSPRNLILDEPTNGLDPQSMRWLRQLVRDYAAAGNTVIISSHLMAEIQDIADDVAIIQNGRLASHRDLRGFVQSVAPSRVEVESNDPHTLATQLHRAGAHTSTVDTTTMVSGLTPREVGAIAYASGVIIHRLVMEQTSLEEVYLDFLSAPSAPAQQNSHPESSHLASSAPRRGEVPTRKPRSTSHVPMRSLT